MSTNEYSLTVREEVKNHRIANGDDLDTTPETNALIDSLIDAVSSRFESKCDRQFLSRDYTEVYDGKGASILYPNQYPITAVTSIKDSSDWDWDNTTAVSGTEYRVVNSNSIVFKSTANSMGDYPQNVQLVYTAGYTTVPYDLENACISEVLRAMEKIGELAISEKRSQDFLLKYIATSFLAETETTLKRYKRRGAY